MGKTIKKPKKAKVVKKRKSTKGIKRIAGKDVIGDLKLERALLQVRGIGPTLAKAVTKVISEELKIPEETQVGDLSDEQIEKIDNILFNLQDYNIPSYLLNRRKDFRTGKDMHVIMNDLIFVQKQDIDREKALYTWRGFRHAYGQKVRGQRTKNTGRFGPSLGVSRKKQQPGKK